MGEVTNVIVEVENVSNAPIDNLIVSVAASDPTTRRHPDQTKRLTRLLPNKTWYEELTVDTETGQQTAITVDLTASGELNSQSSRDDCRDLDPKIYERFERLAGLVL